MLGSIQEPYDAQTSPILSSRSQNHSNMVFKTASKHESTMQTELVASVVGSPLSLYLLSPRLNKVNTEITLEITLLKHFQYIAFTHYFSL